MEPLCRDGWEEVMEASRSGGGEVAPEVVGLSSNPLTTTCVRHCARGEWWGAKRGRGTEVWVSKGLG